MNRAAECALANLELKNKRTIIANFIGNCTVTITVNYTSIQRTDEAGEH